MRDLEAYAAEIERIAGPMNGPVSALERSAAEQDWMVVDSWCRQQIWGGWSGGYVIDGETSLPADDLTSRCGPR